MRNLEKNDFTFGSTLTDKMHSTNYMTSTPTINEPKPDEKVLFKDKKKRRKSINNSSKTLQDIYLINETRIPQFESLVSDIKSNGFEKIKNQIDENFLISTNLENTIKSLTKELLNMKADNTKNESYFNSNLKELKKNQTLLKINKKKYEIIEIDTNEINNDNDNLISSFYDAKNENSKYMEEIECEKVEIIKLKEQIKSYNQGIEENNKVVSRLRLNIQKYNQEISLLKEKIYKEAL